MQGYYPQLNAAASLKLALVLFSIQDKVILSAAKCCGLIEASRLLATLVTSRELSAAKCCGLIEA